MEQYLRQLIAIEFQDKKEIFTGFLIDYSDDWILLRNNPVDYILDGYIILKNKNIEAVHRDQDIAFTEKVIRLKGLKTNAEDIAELLIAQLKLSRRVFIKNSSIWSTNP